MKAPTGPGRGAVVDFKPFSNSNAYHERCFFAPEVLPLSRSHLARLMAVLLVVGLAAIVGRSVWNERNAQRKSHGFALGNGRLEAQEIDVASKIAGKLASVEADEGDAVRQGQVLARLDTAELEAELRRAQAERKAAMEASHIAEERVRQRRVELDFAKRQLDRSQQLSGRNFVSQERLDRDRTDWQRAARELDAARMQVQAENASLAAAEARIAEIQARLDDAVLTAPRDARVLYRLAEPGEVLPAGGKVLTLIDLSDVYMVVFLPTEQAGQLPLGAPARIRLDAWPERPLPGRVRFVSPEAQFTPKQVETAMERQKLVFRVKVQVDADAVEQNRDWIKPGLPGVAVIRLEGDGEWPN